MNILLKLKNRLKQPEIKYTFFLFLSTRLILTAVGAASRLFFLTPLKYSRFVWLDIWGRWDSSWYLAIARNLYPANPGPTEYINYAFFPLYPLLARALGFLLNNNFYLAGIIISNLCLLAASIYLYKLINLKYNNQRLALGSIILLFLFPSSFILSGVFSEALFLLLLILAFYYVEKKQWLPASLAGALLALTRSVGIIIFLPLLLACLRGRRENDWRIKNFFSLPLMPLSFASFLFFSYLKTGKLFPYLGVQLISFGHTLVNPLNTLLSGLASDLAPIFISSFTTILIIALMVKYIKEMDLSWLLAGALLLLTPTAGGLDFAFGFWRYALVVFPLYLLLALSLKNKYAKILAYAGLAAVQLLMLIIWTNDIIYLIL